jgi:hypothetical protein
MQLKFFFAHVKPNRFFALTFHKGNQANAYVGRSPRTDDEEFYAIHLLKVTSMKFFLMEFAIL